MSKKNELDQYYTNPKYAKECMDRCSEHFNLNDYILVEPCAGTGSFYHLFHDKRKGYDLEPKFEDPNIEIGDFLEVKKLSSENVAVISNPPFGYASSLAVKFFNKCASFTEVKYICFIVPKTFMKVSIQNKLNTSMHLIYEKESPKNSFILNGSEYNVPCVFQIWERKTTRRIIEDKVLTSEFFEFTKKENAIFSIRRVGGRSGQYLEGTDYNSNSTYFISCSEENHQKIKNALTNEGYCGEIKTLRSSTAGVNSVSKGELIKLIHKYMR